MLIDPSTQFKLDLAKLRGENVKLVAKIWDLVWGAIDAIETHRDPKHGIGRPEPLTGNLSGRYSRQITEKHRLIYRYSENKDIIYLIS